MPAPRAERLLELADDELMHVVTGHGPKTDERLAFRRRFIEQEQWVRDAVLASA